MSDSPTPGAALRTRHAASVLALVLGASCGGDESGPGQEPPPEEPPAPECDVALLLPNGTCLQSGVPPEACAEGFESDGQRGCTAILPAEPCEPGMLAVPGDADCREVAPCPDSPYGDAPIEATTQFVDASYAGADSDGSMDRPWKTVLEGVEAAESGAVVAIAAGTYQEGVWSGGKAVRLWGRCPAQVEIAGTLPGYATVELSQGDGAEIHDLSISGVSFGVYVYDAQNVVLDRVHIHDTGVEGLVASGHAGVAAVSVTRSLVERAGSIGVAATEATLSIDASVVRDTRDIGADPGWNVYAKPGSVLDVRRSVASGGFLGIAARASQATLEGVVVRDTQIAIGNTADPAGGPSTLVARGSVIERYSEYGAFTDSNLSLSATVFRDAVFVPDGKIPAAIAFNSGADGSVEDSLIERGGDGVVVRSATAAVKRLALRDCSLPGVVILEGSTAELSSSTFERTTAIAIYVGSASSATLRDVIVRETAPKDGLYGDGITAVQASIDISSARIESSARCGVSNFGGVVRIGDAALDCNAVHLDGELYQGAAASFEEAAGKLVCGCGEDGEKECRVESSSLAPPSVDGVTE